MRVAENTVLDVVTEPIGNSASSAPARCTRRCGECALMAVNVEKTPPPQHTREVTASSG